MAHPSVAHANESGPPQGVVDACVPPGTTSSRAMSSERVFIVRTSAVYARRDGCGLLFGKKRLGLFAHNGVARGVARGVSAPWSRRRGDRRLDPFCCWPRQITARLGWRSMRGPSGRGKRPSAKAPSARPGGANAGGMIAMSGKAGLLLTRRRIFVFDRMHIPIGSAKPWPQTD